MQNTRVPLLQPWQTMVSSYSSLCAQEHCYAGTDLGLIVSVKGNYNVKAYKDILYGEEPNMGVILRGPHIFGYVVYLISTGTQSRGFWATMKITIFIDLLELNAPKGRHYHTIFFMI